MGHGSRRLANVVAADEHLDDPTRVAAFFDLDKTVISRSSVVAFGTHFRAAGLLNLPMMLRSVVAQLGIALTPTEHRQVELLRRHATRLSRGWDVAIVRAVVRESLEAAIGPLVFSDAAALIAWHRARGDDIVLVSASEIELVGPIGLMLGVDRVRASEMRVVDGHYAGELAFYCYGHQKSEVLMQEAAAHGYDLGASYAYTDSVSDLPMLQAVGHPRAVNPDRKLRAAAIENGWPILHFASHTPPRSHAALRIATATLGAGATVAAAAAVVRAVRPRPA